MNNAPAILRALVVYAVIVCAIFFNGLVIGPCARE
jgi:hypothetical protein